MAVLVMKHVLNHFDFFSQNLWKKRVASVFTARRLGTRPFKSKNTIIQERTIEDMKLLGISEATFQVW